jgi:hypothetical protein
MHLQQKSIFYSITSSVPASSVGGIAIAGLFFIWLAGGGRKPKRQWHLLGLMVVPPDWPPPPAIYEEPVPCSKTQ